MGLQRITDATLNCVDLATAKLHCKVDVADDDALLTSMILAATDEAEHLMRRAILPQQWLLSLDGFYAQVRPVLDADALGLVFGLVPVYTPRPVQSTNIIELRPVTVASVDLVKYVDDNGTLQTLASTEYQASIGDRLSARLAPAFGKAWPSTRAQMDSVQVTFTSGWPTVAAVPASIKQWVLMRIGAYYANREAWTLGKAIERNPFLDRLLDRWRVPTL